MQKYCQYLHIRYKVRNTKNADSGKFQTPFLGLHFCLSLLYLDLFYVELDAVQKDAASQIILRNIFYSVNVI